MLQDAAVRRGGRVVRFVNDDGVEVWHEAGEPWAATQSLHTGHHRGRRQLIAVGLVGSAVAFTPYTTAR